jgi:DNA-binding NtrC family response regulator
MRRRYTGLRGSHGRKSPRGIAGRAFRLRGAAARSASRLPPRLLALRQGQGSHSLPVRFPAVNVVRELRAYNNIMVRSGVTETETRPSLREITHRAMAEAERQAIRLALQATSGNKSEAARLLRVDYKTLHLKMKRYRIEAREFRTS